MHINAGLNTGSTSSRRRLREGTMDQASTLLVILWFPTKPFQKVGFCLNNGVAGFHLLRRKPVLLLDSTSWGWVFPLTSTFILKKGNGITSWSCTEFFPHGHLYSPNGNGRTSRPALFPSRVPLFPKREWKNVSFPPFSPHGHLHGIRGDWKSLCLAFLLTGTFILLGWVFPLRTPLFS